MLVSTMVTISRRELRSPRSPRPWLISRDPGARGPRPGAAVRLGHSSWCGSPRPPRAPAPLWQLCCLSRAVRGRGVVCSFHPTWFPRSSQNILCLYCRTGGRAGLCLVSEMRGCQRCRGTCTRTRQLSWKVSGQRLAAVSVLGAGRGRRSAPILRARGPWAPASGRSWISAKGVFSFQQS